MSMLNVVLLSLILTVAHMRYAKLKRHRPYVRTLEGLIL